MKVEDRFKFSRLVRKFVQGTDRARFMIEFDKLFSTLYAKELKLEHDEGVDKGREEGYLEGHDVGCDFGLSTGQKDTYDEGWENGYAAALEGANHVAA